MRSLDQLKYINQGTAQALIFPKKSDGDIGGPRLANQSYHFSMCDVCNLGHVTKMGTV